MSDEGWLTAAQVAEALGVDASTVSQRRRRGTGPRAQQGPRGWRYSRADVEAYAAAEDVTLVERPPSLLDAPGPLVTLTRTSGFHALHRLAAHGPDLDRHAVSNVLDVDPGRVEVALLVAGARLRPDATVSRTDLAQGLQDLASRQTTTEET